MNYQMQRKEEIKKSIDCLIKKVNEAERNSNHKDAEQYRNDVSFLIDLLDEYRGV